MSDRPEDLAALRFERRLARARADASSLAEQKDRLNQTLREARETILALRARLNELSAPPQTHATVVDIPGPGLADVAIGGRTLRVSVSPDWDGALEVGTVVLLNDAQLLVGTAEPPRSGDAVRVLETLPDGRVLAAGVNDNESVYQLAETLEGLKLRVGQTLLVDARSGVAFERVPRSDVEELTLDEVPDVSWEDIGGLGEQVTAIRDAVELPFRHRELFDSYRVAAPKGVLLFGPPGCGKTMIAKAVAASSGSHFLNIKGPELLNKFVGETERQIRAIFTRARELAGQGRPVVVFFDEMDALFRTRGSGISSDVESTVVPQLLSEIDGVEGLHNVIVIGATNREDLIDPAILRPGRLDVKIRIERPGPSAAKEIFGKYVARDTPLNAEEVAASGGTEEMLLSLGESVIEALYAQTEENEFVEVTYAGGTREVLHVGDFASGAMIAAVAARAKRAAIKGELSGAPPGLTLAHLLVACRREIEENEQLPNTTNPDDWARVAGRRGERIVFLRTLHGERALTVE